MYERIMWHLDWLFGFCLACLALGAVAIGVTLAMPVVAWHRWKWEVER